MKNHGIDCNCNECKKIRNLLKNKEKKGEINLIGLPEDLEKIRKWTKKNLIITGRLYL